MLRRIIISLCLLTCFGCISGLTENDKILVFYQNERLLIGENRKPGIESGNENRILEIEDISKSYQNNTKKMEEVIIRFLSDNSKKLEDLHISMINKNGELTFDTFDLKNNLIEDVKLEYREQFKRAYDSLQYVKEKIKKELLDQYKEIVRVLIGYWEDMPFEFAREIKKDVFAEIDSNWKSLGLTLFGNEYLNRAGIIGDRALDDKIFDKYGALTYGIWYYETNLKIRIVNQIRDTEGRYYGEFAVDFYKLDKYDKLFDNKGNLKLKQ